MIRLPNTVPIPAPDPATPTVAAPAPMNLEAVSMSLLTALVWKPLSATWVKALCGNRAVLSVLASGLDSTEADRGLQRAREPARTRAGVDTNFAQVNIVEFR